MKKKIQDILYYIGFGLWWIVSILPMPIHYFFSTLIYFVIYYLVGYRRKVVRQNLVECFPDKSQKEIIAIEKGFYQYFCDLMVEAVKFFSITKKEMKHRMVMKGLDRISESVDKGRSIALFLGHNCNWEWVSTFPLWIGNDRIRSLQLYHPLENPVMDRLVGYERERMGSTNITMAQSIRHITKFRQDGPVIVGFISDQVPLWESMNYWLPFFGKDTPTMTGAERIATKMDFDCYYVHMRRVRRGYYEATFELMTDTPKQKPEFWLTEEYYKRLQENICEQPSYWLWSHRRWKRTRRNYVEKLFEEKRWTEIKNTRFCDREFPEGKPCLQWAKEQQMDLPYHEMQ